MIDLLNIYLIIFIILFILKLATLPVLRWRRLSVKIMHHNMYIDENFRSGIAEVISSTKMGIMKAVLYKLAVIQIWNVMLSAGFLVINIIFSLKVNSSTYVWYIVEMFALYFALPYLLASLFGLVLAEIQNKRIGYLGIILLSYVFAGGTRRTPNYYYLIPTEGNNWIRILLWIILLGIFACCLFGTTKDKRRGAVLTGVCIILFCIYVQPFGGAYFGLHMIGHDEWSSDQYYYRIINQYEGKKSRQTFRYLTTSQGIRLLAYFPYYPIADHLEEVTDICGLNEY